MTETPFAIFVNDRLPLESCLLLIGRVRCSACWEKRNRQLFSAAAASKRIEVTENVVVLYLRESDSPLA